MKPQLCRRILIGGYEIVRKIPRFAQPSEIVYAHQELYDGTGYPRGLKGDQIPLGARIFAIADTLDFFTSDTPYEDPQPIKAARKEIEHGSGTQFDPEIVRVFVNIPDKVWSDLRREIDEQRYYQYYESDNPPSIN